MHTSQNQAQEVTGDLTGTSQAVKAELGHPEPAFLSRLCDPRKRFSPKVPKPCSLQKPSAIPGNNFAFPAHVLASAQFPEYEGILGE